MKPQKVKVTRKMARRSPRSSSKRSRKKDVFPPLPPTSRCELTPSATSAAIEIPTQSLRNSEESAWSFNVRRRPLSLCTCTRVEGSRASFCNRYQSARSGTVPPLMVRAGKKRNRSSWYLRGGLSFKIRVYAVQKEVTSVLSRAKETS